MQEDLYHLPDKFLIAPLAEQFEEWWNEELQMGKKPLVIDILRRQFGKRFLPMGLLKLLMDVSTSISPLMIQQILLFLEQKSSNPSQSPGIGILYSFILFGITMISTIAISQFFQKVQGIGMIVRGVLTSAIYRKSLRLSSKSRQTFDSGKITSIIATDCVRIDSFLMFFHLMWTYSFQIILIFSLLIATIGISALSGIALLVVMIPIQVVITNRLIKLRKSNAPKTDSRIKLTQEVFRGMQIVKMFSWETPFLEKIMKIRNEELTAVITSKYMLACNSSIVISDQ